MKSWPRHRACAGKARRAAWPATGASSTSAARSRAWEYRAGKTTFTREHLASAVDHVIALRFTASAPGAIHFRLRLERGPRENFAARFFDTLAPAGGRGFVMKGREAGEGAVAFAAALLGAARGGSLSLLGETLIAEGADEVLLVLAAGTTFREEDPARASLDRAGRALERGWNALRADHVADYRGWFDRVALDLGPGPEQPTDARLTRFHEGEADPDLAALYFDFGRYLLISSSRPGSLPPNLQGLWNAEFFSPWGSKYTLNINAEMNYWPTQPCALAELQQPLFDLLERLRVTGREVAGRMYGCRGFVVHHNTDLWADACPVDRNLAASFWPLGGAWLCLHLWEHFAFSRDRDFLRRAYPTLREAALFFLDFLQPDAQGRLVVIPASSPENVFRRDDGRAGTLCSGVSMDGQILGELFAATAEAAALLGEDAEFAADVEAARRRLPAPAIGRHGQLLEWLEDYDETDPHHRHISHLFALYPGAAISPSRTPELARACRVTLRRRGDASTGWSLAWKIGCRARLGDGDHAERLLRLLLTPVTATGVTYGEDGGSYTNLLCVHPPFQIDGNFGGTAAIAEMLVQSHLRAESAAGGLVPEVQLLPALPGAWPRGEVRGLRLRGHFHADLSWRERTLREMTLHAPQGGTLLLRYGKIARELTFAAGETKTLNGKLEPVAAQSG